MISQRSRRRREEAAGGIYNAPMRWILVILVCIMVLMTCVPWLSRFGLGRLPGDINFRVFGRRISIPLASTLLIFLLFFLIGKFL